MAPKSRISNSISNKTFANLALGIQDGEWWRERKKIRYRLSFFYFDSITFPPKRAHQLLPSHDRLYFLWYFTGKTVSNFPFVSSFFVACFCPSKEGATVKGKSGQQNRCFILKKFYVTRLLYLGKCSVEEDTSSVALSEFPVASVRTLPDKNPAGIRRRGDWKNGEENFYNFLWPMRKKIYQYFPFKSCLLERF